MKKAYLINSPDGYLGVTNDLRKAYDVILNCVKTYNYEKELPDYNKIKQDFRFSNKMTYYDFSINQLPIL